MEEITERLSVQHSEEDKEKLKHLQEEYLEYHYKDSSPYPENVNKWKTGFEKYLSLRGDSNPKRGIPWQPKYSTQQLVMKR